MSIITLEQRQKSLEAIKQGYGKRRVSKIAGISTTTAQRWLNLFQIGDLRWLSKERIKVVARLSMIQVGARN